ncbi:ribonuclease H-like domain-containing protein [Mobilitalea sibirica]|uniref:Ribonuclease H-like domain-containing protein n=1 Tax=Mobilitalea sibirica TaxID=1462919 RepID=A0A8J7H0Q5_9FIRM|nr:ribonuclease H-like domain-containing protein [Mobilitalea sibirica]MBH1939722.1 ribonuclease H-like domain-containing protein [Mobilitalea sibirica]
MITRQFPVDLELNYSHNLEFELEKLLFFDIETTGFAADTTYLYLIGCLYYKASSFYIIQWFSEDINEEAKIISAFFEFMKDYEAIIHYNGTGFDIPYLLKKCSLLQLDYNFDHIRGIDLYKKISPYKKIFKLGNFKQKSIEKLLGIDRKDTLSGGDLIEIYQSYLGKRHIENLKKKRNSPANAESPSQADELLGALLLHNEDDLKGLVSICPILSYADLFEKPFRILQAGVDNNKMTIRFEVQSPLPVRISFGNDYVYFTAYQKTASITIDIYEGELKHFYDNYRDYYYLPMEDTAMHKSLALYVDKEYRQKAKPSNCYTKKQGVFAPLYDHIISPVFKSEYQDRLCFIEIHTDFLLQEENLELYVTHILSHMLTAKSK